VVATVAVVGMGWTNKRRAFLEEYLKCWNATEAARRAGYKYPNVQGPTLVNLSIIKDAIAERLESMHMTAEEVLSLQAAIARADMSDFVKTESPLGGLDISAIAEHGRLVKKVKWTKNGVEIELHDSQRAQQWLGKHLGLTKERVKHTGEIQVQLIGNITPDDV